MRPLLTAIALLGLLAGCGREPREDHDHGRSAAHVEAPDAEHHHDGDAIHMSEAALRELEVVEVAVARVHDALRATGVLRVPADAEAYLHAPAAGHLQPAGGAFPRVGQRVKRGQLLARLVPHLGADADLASLELQTTRARIALERARQDRERLESLYHDEAVAEKRVLAARAEEALAGAELDAARQRLHHYRGDPAARGEHAGLPLLAPIDGVLAAVTASPGAFLAEGAHVLHVVDATRLWLEVRVPESQVGRLGEPAGAWFRVEGFEPVFNLDAGNSRVVAVGRVVDPASRTLPLIYEITRPDPRLPVGVSADVNLRLGDGVEAPVVPAGAVMDEAGTPVVYVQVEDDAFERRAVVAGVREGDRIAVTRGLQAGEKVVARGAYLVRLAGSATGIQAHGHDH